MLKISFQNQTSTEMQEYQKLAKKIIVSAVKILELENENLNLSINFIDKQEAQKMNLEYRNKNYIPDVISFPIEMTNQEVEALGFREIGDIFICFAEAQRKSIKYQHTVVEEMGFLFVHGFLHLLGFDHETNLDDEKEMFDLQTKILLKNKINYEIKFIEEDYEVKENEF
ncbi:rRNA maturation RNase YbeY [Williamsoniiplasma luminosum]|uniref:Endoribonuclease YbeY n=1 Tax=Williamsoniiplasma luminosum TaxID=214888 RepID=A0A2S0NJG8_9MOLU|nr:rRNA maturation RNase YbeY [Williamsoniiplasma luminosum]AVP49170.1 MAG: rRNA maturation RNase YbeY [Williamsoniiplasma luminosum]